MDRTELRLDCLRLVAELKGSILCKPEDLTSMARVLESYVCEGSPPAEGLSHAKRGKPLKVDTATAPIDR